MLQIGKVTILQQRQMKGFLSDTKMTVVNGNTGSN